VTTVPTRGLAVALLAVALLQIAPPQVAPALARPGPWARTERRAPCASFDLFRQPLFGDTHVHTAYSSDAVFAGTREDPRGAYRFAKGETIGLAPYDAQGNPTRTARLRRPLDFTAVTDHAEQFGEMRICLTPGLPGYDSADCVGARAQLAEPLPPRPALLPPGPVIQFLLGYGVTAPAQRFAWCGPDGGACLAQASLVWEDTQAAAEQHYDRSAACAFTTFVAYEWSAQPRGNNLHRNVIFRNDVVPALPTSYMEEYTPEGLWEALRRTCLDGLPGCDVLAIPHNPNVSGGLMFAPTSSDGTPLTAEAASLRASMEPVIELTQHKGDSECRPGVGGSTDELCGYEKLNRLQLFSPTSSPDQDFPPLAYVRNALRAGLEHDERLGANPFRLGVVGSTDDHNAAPGNVEEPDYGKSGHVGGRERHPASILARVTPAGIEGNPGGLAVVWAEENSRDAIFAALRRREVYATSGTRPILRFFAGRQQGLSCDDPDFVARAYAGGAPMGATIGPVRGGASPRFAVLAQRDPGTVEQPGTRLQRVQIVKGWVDASGASHEKVYDVAGEPENGAGVDTATCTPTGGGADTLCAVWRDPEFDHEQRAFYYARLIENPTCRWSTYVCNELGLDCSRDDVPADYAECCNPEVPKTIQERAWSSPIWYRPEAVARLDGDFHLGRDPRRTTLRLRVELGTFPEIDLARDDLQVTLSDDDVVYAVRLPAGLLRESSPGRFVWRDPTGSVGGLRELRLERTPRGSAVLRLKTAPRNFPHLERRDHFMQLAVRSGGRELVDATTLWRLGRLRLATRG